MKNLNNPANTYRILIKFMDEKYVESFKKYGELFMRNIDYFKKENFCEDIHLRNDKYEGLTASYKADKVSLFLGNKKIEGMVGKVDISFEEEKETMIYCMTKISDKTILEAGENGFYLSSKFQGFGNRAIVIAGYNITEFEKRLKIAITSNPNILLHKNHQIIGKQISYLNRCNYHGEMNIFNKFDEYSWQNEFRIGFKLKNKTDTYKLKLGNLSDIVYEFKTEDLINNPIKLHIK